MELHPDVSEILQYFSYTHLPKALQDVSQPICILAYDMANSLPQNTELIVGMRKLLEAKDAFVRSVVSLL